MRKSHRYFWFWSTLLLCVYSATPHAAERRGWWESAQDRTAPPGPPSWMPSRQSQGTMPAKTHARLRLQRRGEQYLVWIDNGLYSPAEIVLHSRNLDQDDASPALPLRMVVPARGTVLATRLRFADTGRTLDLRMETTPGPTDVRPQDYRYRLPFESAPLRIDQGFGGAYSHSDPQNRYAIDFSLPEGTPVVAARDGTVMQIESDPEPSGLRGESGGGPVSFIRILHSDGTMAMYAHLRDDGGLVRAGQQVVAGQAIAHSGNTGFSTAPHLHFSVQVNRGGHLESVPFRMFSDQSELKFPRIETEASPPPPDAEEKIQPADAG